VFRNPEVEEIRTLLRIAGIRYKNGLRYFQIRCPYHDDHTPSALVYKDNGYFKCFTCLTERPFYRLYKDLTGTEWDGKVNLSLNMFRNTDVIAKRVKSEYRLNKLEKDHYVDFDTSLMNVEDIPMAKAYCDSREVSSDFISAFGIRVLESGKVNGISWADRLITPLFDSEGIMRSAEGRDYTRNQQKKVMYPVNTSVNFIFNAAGLDPDKTLIIVEGLMDVHKIWQWITKNITCTFGIQLKEHQKEQLKSFRDIILFIDDDDPGRLSIEQFEKFYPYDFRVAISPDNDPGSSNRRQLESALENAKLFNVFLMDDLGIFPERKRLSLHQSF
jgi:DNA primase